MRDDKVNVRTEMSECIEVSMNFFVVPNIIRLLPKQSASGTDFID